MTRYVALLRAVNLGSTNKVGMKWLREAAGDAGFTDVATYVQSGNVVLTSSGSADEVSDTVARLIKAEYGLDIDVIVRDRKQIAAVVKANPFGDLIEEPTRVHVNFLSAAPPKSKLAALDPDEFAPERYVVKGSEMYLYYPGGAGRSRLATAPWGKRLGVIGTSRNWRTVTTLLEMLDAAGG
jgi:uncharacterized protein (DUF1697 family)